MKCEVGVGCEDEATVIQTWHKIGEDPDTDLVKAMCQDCVENMVAAMRQWNETIDEIDSKAVEV